MFNPIPEESFQANIKIIGVGGGGCNALNRIAETENVADLNSKGVEMYAVNTDAQALKMVNADIQTVQIGAQTTGGLG
ncbi:hypothetical protein B0187_03540 [Haemophilus paracuniculus]|uniref:Tubulin/FtsZ GTPase domain-containing protein n=2 Tax=Haemophilus paracuniculus TaxID=734 RepID=A0A1T0ATT7_9PAST|nr:hypothetical protein B0187_03540 [Haemophilus paracuniculus]